MRGLGNDENEWVGDGDDWDAFRKSYGTNGKRIQQPVRRKMPTRLKPISVQSRLNRIKGSSSDLNIQANKYGSTFFKNPKNLKNDKRFQRSRRRHKQRWQGWKNTMQQVKARNNQANQAWLQQQAMMMMQNKGTSSSQTQTKKTDNTLLYVGAGVGTLIVVGGLAYALTSK